MKTPTATIGIRGTTFIVEWVEPDEAARLAMAAYVRASTAAVGEPTQGVAGVVPLQLAQNAASGGGLAPGLYVHVIDGLIQLSNRGGVQQFAAGQFGFTGSVVQPPVIVPKNPGIQFNPPPAFSSSTGTGNSSSSSKPKTVDCEVR